MMKFLAALGIVSATALTTYLVPAQAQKAPEAPAEAQAEKPFPGFQRAHWRGGDDGERGPRHHWQGGGRPDFRGPPPRMREAMSERMAERLAQLEVTIGIKSDQLDTWRTYTSALIAMTERPDRAERRAAAQDRAEQLPGERIADRITDRAEKAESFRQAAGALRSALTPEQIATLNDAAREMGPRGHKGRFGGHGPRAERPAPAPDAAPDAAPEQPDAE